MDLANPVKLLWRVGLILYGLSGGSPDSKQPAAVKEETGDLQAAARAKSRHDRKARSEKPTRQQLQLEIDLLEAELQLKRLQLESLELEAKLEQLRNETNQKVPVNQQPPAKLKPPQLLDDFQYRASVDRLDLRDSMQRGGHPIDGAKGWRVDAHGVIRDRLYHPIGTWGVDDDSSTLSRAID